MADIETDKVATIYQGGKAPRLGLVLSGKLKGHACVHNGKDWEPIVDLNKHADLFQLKEKKPKGGKKGAKTKAGKSKD